MAWVNRYGSSGYYINIGSDDWYNNVQMIYNQLHAFGWADGAIAGVIGNMERESTLNPWLWQGNRVGDGSAGYGLTQVTPASLRVEQCNFPGYGPYEGNPATASQNDGTAQLYGVDQDIPKKWYTDIAIPVRGEAAREHGVYNQIVGLRDYSTFKQSSDPYAAGMAWLFWHEYPLAVHPGQDSSATFARNENAIRLAYQYIAGHDPGPAPTPTTEEGRLPYGAIRDLQRRILKI